MASESVQARSRDIGPYFSPESGPHLTEQEDKVLKLANQILDCRGSDEVTAIQDLKKFRKDLKELKKESPGDSSITAFAERILHLSKNKESWISDKSPVPVHSLTLQTKTTPDLFAHIHGDSFITGSGLEAGYIEDSIRYVLKSLLRTPLGLDEAKRKSLQDTFVAARAHLAKTNVIYDDLHQHHLTKNEKEQVRILEGLLGPLVTDLRNAFNAGNASLLPGGWSHPSGAGHGMCYEVLPQADGRVTFRVYDRGVSFGYHGDPKYDKNGKARYPAYLEIQDIDPETFFTPQTLRLLLAPRILGDLQKRICNAQILYEEIFPKLKGRKVDHAGVEMEILMGPQKSGTCSWKSVAAFLRKQMTFLEYKRFMFELKRESLFACYEEVHEQIVSIPNFRHLFEASLAKHKLRLEKFKEKGYIDEQTYQTHSQDLFLLTQSFSSAKKVYLQKLSQQAVPPSVAAGVIPQSSGGVVPTRTVTGSDGNPVQLFVDDESANIPLLQKMTSDFTVFCNDNREPVLMQIAFSSDNTYEFDIKLVNGEKRWECRQMPGYYLHADPFIGQLELVGIKDYLRLVTEDGRERVLLSQHELADALVEKDEYAKNKNLWGVRLQPESKGVVYFDVQDSNQGNVSDWQGSPKARLYLGMRMLGSMREEGYVEATKLLSRNSLSDLEGTDEEMALLDIIANIQKKNNDKSPRALEFCMRAIQIRSELTIKKIMGGQGGIYSILQGMDNKYLKPEEQDPVVRVSQDQRRPRRLSILGKVRNWLKNL